MAPRSGVKALIAFGFTIMSAAWPGPVLARDPGTEDLFSWRGEAGFHNFVPGHEMDYVLDVFWRRDYWTRLGKQDFLACGDMRIRKDGEIHYTKYGTRRCSNKERYRLVEAIPEYIVLFVEILDFHGELDYERYEYWVLVYDYIIGLQKYTCRWNSRPGNADYVGAVGFVMPLSDLRYKWSKSVHCNPKLLSPDPHTFWSEYGYGDGYYLIKSKGSPAYKDGVFIYK